MKRCRLHILKKVGRERGVKTGCRGSRTDEGSGREGKIKERNKTEIL